MTQHPTPAEARAMFEENPGLAVVVTTAGQMQRDGQFVDARWQAHANMSVTGQGPRLGETPSWMSPGA